MKIAYRDSKISAARTLSLPYQHGDFHLHTHIRAELYCLLRGSVVFYIEGSEYRLNPGDILLMRPAEAHYALPDFSQPYERIVLNFEIGILSSLDPDNLLMKPLFERQLGKCNLYRNGDFPNQIHLQYLHGILTDSTNRHPVVLANLTLLLQEISLIFGKQNQSTDLQETLEYRIIRYISSHLNQDLTIPELCNRFFLSRTQLCRRFKNVTGSSVGKFISTKRLITARQMILSGMKATDVFSACGYQDYSTFYRAYSRYYGHSPRDALLFSSVSSDETDYHTM